MRLLCVAGRHKAPSPYFTIHEGDTWYGECPFCSEQIIMMQGKTWEEVPDGFRVIWIKDKPTLVERHSPKRSKSRIARILQALVMLAVRP